MLKLTLQNIEWHKTNLPLYHELHQCAMNIPSANFIFFGFYYLRRSVLVCFYSCIQIILSIYSKRVEDTKLIKHSMYKIILLLDSTTGTTSAIFCRVAERYPFCLPIMKIDGAVINSIYHHWFSGHLETSQHKNKVYA